MNLSKSNEGRKRVLHISFAFSPFTGSEPGVGWNRAFESAKRYDTWVVVCDTPGIDGPIDEVIDVPGLNIVRVPRTKLEKVLGRIPMTRQLAYAFWQRRVLPVITELHRQHQFDLVHHVTYCTFREPGYSWTLGAPFVWGPVGGTQNFPYRFLSRAGLRGGLGELTRNCLNSIQLYTGRRFHKAGRHAAALIAANSTAQYHFKKHLGRDSVLICDAGCAEIIRANRSHESEPLRIIWSGIITTRKALNLLIEALAQLPRDVKYELRIAGDGSDRRRCAKLAHRLGLNEHVKWLGWVSHNEAKKCFSWADVLVFTSLRDTSGTVLCEALCHGVPVICLNHQGARDIITDDCGIKVPLDSPGQTVRSLSEAIATLARDRSALRSKSRSAFERAKEYLWSAHGERMAAVYQSVWDGRRPEEQDSESAAQRDSPRMDSSEEVSTIPMEESHSW